MRASVAAAAAAATLATGALLPSGALAAQAAAPETTVVTPNPWYANGPFQGWGTSLAWLANATGNYGEEGSITTSSGDAAADQKALEYGKQLRNDFYEAIFGEEGLDLNMARYNIGGGNATDVAYGFPFMRQGAAVPGYWADTIDGVEATQANKDKVAAAFDPTDDSDYDWSKGSAQEWWLKHGVETGDIDHIETFANSAPWFLTNSGYATGNFNAGDNNVKDATKFGQYMAHVTDHLNDEVKKIDPDAKIATVEPLNESETSYWGTTRTRADKPDLVGDTGSGISQETFDYYWNKYFADKNKSVTPYGHGVKKAQEGMHVDSQTAQKIIKQIAETLKAEGNTDTVVSATDATDSGQFVDSYNKYSQDTRDAIGQYNTHSYGTSKQRVARDIAQGDDKNMSMSEVDASFQSGGFDPFNTDFSNGLGMAKKINSDVYALQSKDFTFWQVVEDLYNMATGTTDINGTTAKVKGENTNWGTVLIDFDCNVAGKDGKLYSERAYRNNGDSTEGIAPCSVLANTKYNAVRAYTKFVHEGDSVIANNATGKNFTVSNKDGKQTVIHTNDSSKPETLVIDLSKYATIADDASGTAYLTTAPAEKGKATEATIAKMNETSNVKQSADAVTIDAKAKTATVTVPAKSIMSVQLTGVSGVADSAKAVADNGGIYQIVGEQSGRAVAAKASGDSAISLADLATDEASAKAQSWTFTPIDMSEATRSSLRAYTITNGGKTLVVEPVKNDKGEITSYVNKLVDSSTVTATDPVARWILNTEDGSTWQLVNASAKRSMDVDGSNTAAGTKVGLWESSAGRNQTFTLRSTTPTGAKAVNVQVNLKGDVAAALPETVTPYYTWGTGAPAAVTWNDVTDQVDTATEGTYTVTGTATDIFGNEFAVTATVYVGPFTVVDPVSVTVLPGTSWEAIQQAVAGVEIHAHVGASEAVTLDQTAYPVSWDWNDEVQKALAEAQAGGTVTVNGSVKLAGDDAKASPVTLTVFVTDAVPVNVADVGTNLTVSSQESGKANEWKKLTDGDFSTPAWSTWQSGTNTMDPTPTATVDFGSTVRKVSSMTITYTESNPKSVKAEYFDGKDWKQFGETVDSPFGTVTFSVDKPVEATKVRIVNECSTSTYMKATEIQVFATPVPGETKNVADTGSNLTVTGQQTEYGKKDQWKKLTDGDTSAEAWITWRANGADYDLHPTATVNFGNTTEQVGKVTITYLDKAPISVKAEYTADGTTWQPFGETVNNPSGTVTFSVDQPVAAKQVRIVNDCSDGRYMNASEIQVFAVSNVTLTPQPASDATLGALRLDGENISKDFDPSKTEYTVTLPLGAESNPKVQAYARDNAATVAVDMQGVENGLGGKAVITVTSADGRHTSTTTVNFNVATLTGIKLGGTLAKTKYRIGEKLDLTGLTVTAVYSDGTTSNVALDDSQLAVLGFDSTTAGTKTVTVSYRGKSATFQVTVQPDHDESGPGATPQQPAGQTPALSQTGAAVTGVAALAILAALGAAIALRFRRA